MHKLVITTACSRPENLPEVQRSIFGCAGARCFDIEWHVVFDATAVREVPINVVEEYATDPSIVLSTARSTAAFRGYALFNTVLEACQGEDAWHYVLDDDNLLHPELLARIDAALQLHPAARGFIFSQWIGGNDFSGLDVRQAKPENVALSKVDLAQYLLHSSLIGSRRYSTHDVLGDGRFIADVFKNAPDAFVFLDEVLSYYNRLRAPGRVALPRVLVVGRTGLELRSRARAKWESDELTVQCIENDAGVVDAVARFDPHAIVTFGATPQRFPSLFGLSYDLRRRWIDVGDDLAADEIGERAYNCAMNYILNRSADPDYRQPLVSVFTPLNDTGELLRRTYRSVAAQTYTNWEWVVIDDSPRGTATLHTAQEIASHDPRVKVYDVHGRSGGTVGEAKYRAAMLCRGTYLVELDHDDELTPWALDLAVQAFTQFPEAGFAYSDCAEVDDQRNSLTYPDGFAFGYGAYYEEKYGDARLQVIRQPGINPKTIRHIVGVPNHFRAWRHDVYHALGGHNRCLSIADDYDLLVRTFLATRMVHVPVLCYLQYLSRQRRSRNAQSTARADIQRRVRSIAWHYEAQIRQRFAELGLVDWASQENPQQPLSATSRFGADEQHASLRMTPGVPPAPVAESGAGAGFRNVVVCGGGKSGTTALFFAIAAALEGEKKLTFEPQTPPQIAFAAGVHNLCKILVDGGVAQRFVPILPRFDKRVFIVRDVRDVLVSRALYHVRDRQFVHDPSRLAQFLDALRRKEQDVDAVGIVDLLRLAGELEGSADHVENNLRDVLLPMQIWSELQSTFHLVRYEDFVAQRTGLLSAYLGVAVSGAVEVPGWVRRVARTRSSGDWRNWFTASDIETLRPRLAPFLRFFDYADDWQMNPQRRVRAEHASGYVAWIVQQLGEVQS